MVLQHFLGSTTQLLLFWVAFFILGLIVHSLLFPVNCEVSGIAYKSVTVLLLCYCTFFFSILFYIFLYDVALEVGIIIGQADETQPSFVDAVFLSQSINYVGDVCGIIVVMMFFICLASIYYCIQFSLHELNLFLLYSIAIFNGGFLFLAVENYIALFVSYELLLLPTCLVLDHFSKTHRGKEAADFMIFWTQIGALCLFFILFFFSSIRGEHNFLLLCQTNSRLEVNLLILLVFFAFGTKIPVWPFYWWLPEAHVEVATAFSIVLSGVSIKFAFLGLMRFIFLLGSGDIWWFCTLIVLIGFFDALLKTDSETDIKKLVAYQTVTEMHAFTVYLFADFDTFADFIFFALPIHCWVSSVQFMLVDIVARRYHTRNLEHLYGILSESPRIVKFIFFITFIYTSIPGTGVFSVEFLIQVLGSGLPLNFVLFFGAQFILAVACKNVWWLVWGGDALYHVNRQPFMLTRQEYFFILFLLAQLLPCMALSSISFV